MKKYLFLIITISISVSAIAQRKNAKTVNFKVWGACEMCKERIEQTAFQAKASKATWDVNTQILTVSFDSLKTSTQKIKQKIAAVGHDTEEFKADDDVYQKLPGCCHYNRGNEEQPNETTEHTNDATKDNFITGIVLEETKKGMLLPIAQATVRCLSNNEVHVITDSTGIFRLPCAVPTTIVVSYVGFKTDTIHIKNYDELKIILKNASGTGLTEVVVTSKRASTYISSISTLNTLNISAKELTKAACCNLSESFETSPSVDVSYSDAVTGMKQIQLLGLSGNYSQMLVENIPSLRGLVGSYGLTFIPGSWIESIQVTKGTGSVANGYESIAGQINIEEKKPDAAEKLFLNVYANQMGRFEGNANFTQKLNDKWSTALLLHGNISAVKIDDNKDGFLDAPIGQQINVTNRWKYNDNKGLVFQTAIKALADNRQAGQKSFNPSTDKFTTNAYGVGIKAEQFELQTKLGYVFPQQKYKSIGLMLGATHYKNNAYYGLTPYNGKQQSIYANLIYQSIIGNTNHKYRTGISWQFDEFNEVYKLSKYQRTENVPGLFFEYTFSGVEKLNVVAGVRSDFHNNYGTQFTPRLHIKYAATNKTDIRLSLGSGFRTANIFAENTGLMASARNFIIQNNQQYAYGLNPDKAWNYGLGIVQNFEYQNRKGAVSVDAYYTNFTNQIVTDVDVNAQQVIFYNLHGKSYSTSIQVEANYPLFPNFDVRLAYRWLDVKTTYNHVLLQKPLTAAHRAFINLAYETNNHWKFDYTMQWNSAKRIPNTSSNPVDKQMKTYSPSFVLANAQITKQWNNGLEIYIGAENLGSFMQDHVIIDAANPFGNYFDASMIWGPIHGRTIYTGLRFKIK